MAISVSMSSHVLLRVQEVAERLNVRQSTIRAWLLQRRLPYVKVGRCVRIPIDAIDRLINENTVPIGGRK
jgi:excisionase family DNA binding protein